MFLLVAFLFPPLHVIFNITAISTWAHCHISYWPIFLRPSSESLRLQSQTFSSASNSISLDAFMMSCLEASFMTLYCWVVLKYELVYFTCSAESTTVAAPSSAVLSFNLNSFNAECEENLWALMKVTFSAFLMFSLLFQKQIRHTDMMRFEVQPGNPDASVHARILA